MAKGKKIRLVKEWALVFSRFKSKKGNQSPMWVTSKGNPTVEVTHFEKWT